MIYGTYSNHLIIYTLKGLVCYSLDFPSHNYLCKYIYFDVLKTDIDGSEWTALTSSVETGEVRMVRQLLVAICANPNHDYKNGIEKLSVVKSRKTWVQNIFGF